MRKARYRRTSLFLYIMILLFLCVSQGCGRTGKATEPAEAQMTETDAAGWEESGLVTEDAVRDDSEIQEADTQNTETVRDSAGEYTAPSDHAAPSDLAVPSGAGALHVEGTKLTGADGSPVQLKGISTHGLAWFPQYVNKACFRQLHDEWNVNVIRLAMYTAEYGGYCSGGDKEQLKKLIADGVSYAADCDMYVIIDWHVLSDADPNRYKEEAKSFFAEMSETYKDCNHVLYEICNEPNGNTGWKDIKAYAEEIIGTIRANDKDAVILVGTPNWSQYVDQAAADPITEYDNIMYTLHFYAATHKDDLRGKLTAAVGAGLPVFVSEYGICDASGNGAVDEEQADRWISLMDSCGISYVAWNLSNKEETSAVIKSSCEKTSGFGAEDLSESGQWLYQMLTGKHEFITSNADIQEKEENREVQTEDALLRQESASEGKNAALSNGDIQISAALVNQWEENGTPVYQYSLTLQNHSGSDCAQWSIDITFAEEFSLKDGWNGEYSAQGSTLHIISKDYNGSIPAGASITDIGFIVSGGGGIQTD